MKTRRNNMRASFVQTLVYFDEPILALLQNRKGMNVLAYVVRDGVHGFTDPYIAKPTNEKLLGAYFDQKIDLSYLMHETKGGKPYIFDWDKFDDEVIMEPVEEVVKDYESLLPPPGIFSRNHTERRKNITVTSLIAHAFKIDGRWSAGDFSRFYAKLADLYAIFSFVDEMKGSAFLAQKLSDKIAKYPWQRGGSYVGFFKDIASESREEYPLQVSKIKYASPGEIEVKGVKTSLDHIDSLVIKLDGSKADLSTTYKELRGILERDGVLGTDDQDFSVRPVADLAKTRASKLLAGLGIEEPSTILKACDDHLVTYSKIALAIYRRGEEFHRFHAEGRMRLPSSRLSSFQET